jgi:transcription elongation factor Elf1
MENKICTKCGAEKLLSEFYFDSTNNAYRSHCKPCQIASQSVSNAKRDKVAAREYMREYMRKYRSRGK